LVVLVEVVQALVRLHRMVVHQEFPVKVTLVAVFFLRMVLHIKVVAAAVLLLLAQMVHHQVLELVVLDYQPH
jgi:hypothetical protein